MYFTNTSKYYQHVALWAALFTEGRDVALLNSLIELRASNIYINNLIALHAYIHTYGFIAVVDKVLRPPQYSPVLLYQQWGRCD